MDRQIPTASRVISQKINKENRIKHLKKLSEIRKKSTFSSLFHLPQDSKPKINNSMQENRNLQIEKSNIVLFNRISEIIKKKPVGTPTGIDRTRSYMRKKKYIKPNMSNKSLRSQNQFFEKRISQQKPTIDNKLLFKERKQNQRYLGFIGRFPYQFFKRHHTQEETQRQSKQQPVAQQLFNISEGSQGFQISILKNSMNSYAFTVRDRLNNQYKCELTAYQFKRQYEKAHNDYRTMVTNLRLKQNGQMLYQFKE